jgi:diguanylate cyclase (GGDEF)-like protein
VILEYHLEMLHPYTNRNDDVLIRTREWIMTNKFTLILCDALDHMEAGVIVLDDILRVQFINRSFFHMWDLPEMVTFDHFTLAELMKLSHDAGLEDELQDAHIASRISRVIAGYDAPSLIRLRDGRIIKYECISLPTGSRMLSYSDQTELIRSAEKLESVVNVDALTQMHNRRYIHAYGKNEVVRALRYHRQLSVVIVAVDHFKDLNAQYGYSAADSLLCSVAQCCRTNTRASDVVGRLGGAEFCVILPETSKDAAMMVAEKLRTKIANLVPNVGMPGLVITVSLGVASLTAKDRQFEELLTNATNALVLAKKNGRNRVVAEVS